VLAKSIGGAALIEQADLADAAQVTALFTRLQQAHGKLRGVVFSVATPFANKLTYRVPWSAFEQQIDTQLKALHLCAAAAFPLMADTGGPRSFVVVSTEFVLGAPPVKTAPYVAAKAAITAYAQVIAQEWLGRGVRVQIVAPGLVKTAMVAEMPDEFLDQMAQAMPEKRLTRAEDVAAMVAFLVSDAGDPLYGTPVRVSRGDRF
jgi:3-oxoacyl-[acyl-carrier protein] reductase